MTDPFLEDWERLFTQNPKVLWSLVADIAKAVKASEGERKTGRRPSVSVRSLDELYSVLFPDSYVDVEFCEALARALDQAKLSQRRFAEVAGFNQATVSRLLSGKSAPTIELMERIAHALHIRPTYFSEYRAMKLGQVVTSVLLANPNLSITNVRRLAGAGA